MPEDKYPTDYPRDPHFSGVSHENATREPRAEVDDRGGVYRRDENRYDPRDNEGRYPEQAPEESTDDPRDNEGRYRYPEQAPEESTDDPRDNEGRYRYPEQAPEESTGNFTHYVHLANGDVIRHNLIDPLSTHFNPGDGDVTGGHKIIGVYPR